MPKFVDYEGHMELLGIAIIACMLVCFVTLKLGGVISWSWLWVLAPLWIPLFLCGMLAIWALATMFRR